MQFDYLVLSAVFTVLYLLLKQWWPEFPLDQATFNTVLLALLAKAGIDVGQPAVVRAFAGVRKVYLARFSKKTVAKKNSKK